MWRGRHWFDQGTGSLNVCSVEVPAHCDQGCSHCRMFFVLMVQFHCTHRCVEIALPVSISNRRYGQHVLPLFAVQTKHVLCCLCDAERVQTSSKWFNQTPWHRAFRRQQRETQRAVPEKHCRTPPRKARFRGPDFGPRFRPRKWDRVPRTPQNGRKR